MKWNDNAKRFVGCSLAVAAAIVLAGWFTGARLLVHTALIGVAVVALLPLLVLAVVFFLPALFIVVTFGIFGIISIIAVPEAVIYMGTEAAMLGAPIVPWYYRVLRQQKHPHFWGGLCGLILGAGVLAALIAILIVPGETRTVQILAKAQAEIDAVYRSKSSFPQPDEKGHLLRGALTSNAETGSVDGVVLDGFGRPLLYETKGHWKVASYRLKSLGYDGRPGLDDLCIAGSTKLATLADATSTLLQILRGQEDGSHARFQDKLRGIQILRCD